MYQKVILEHNRNPRNFCVLEEATHKASKHNPLCGDKVEIFLVIEDEKVQKACFQGAGCAISTATASLLTEAIQGKQISEVEALFERVQQMLSRSRDSTETFDDLGELAVLQGMNAYPARIKCVTLSWFALEAALSFGAAKTADIDS